MTNYEKDYRLKIERLKIMLISFNGLIRVYYGIAKENIIL